MYFRIFFLVTIVLFAGCIKKDYEIKDISTVSQDTYNYVANVEELDENIQQQLDKQFNETYFKPWDLKKTSYTLEQSTWGFVYAKKEVYGQNYRLLSQEWFNIQIQNSNFKNFNKISKKAITITNTNLRVFPTKKPIFYDPKKAGEGFPFDYNQNSSIYINTPIFISHFSKDKAWVFVESNFALGWLSIKDIAFVDDKIVKKFKNNNYAVAIKDDFSLYHNDIFMEKIKLGTIFPKKDNKFLIVVKDKGLNGVISYVYNDAILNKPVKFNKHTVSSISSELLGEPYGWGGLLDTRDCSSMTKDFFTPFGIYLKRNSYGQTQIHKYISLKDFDNDNKKRFIIKNGKPFLTILYLKGHVMLYIGDKNGEPVVFHQSWGIRTLQFNNESGRQIIGKTAITTLEPGKELWNYDESVSLINRIEGMVLIN